MIENIISHIYFVSYVIFLYMTFWFLISVLAKRNDIADTAWGLGFVTVVFSLYYKYGFSNLYFAIIFALVTLWGLRLTLHIFTRNINKKEDKRYIELTKSWGKWFYLRSYLQVFLLQGFLMLLVSMSAIVASSYVPGLFRIMLYRFPYFLYFGVLVWFVGFIFETVGDYQLSRFLSNPKNKGKIMSSGLWRYTRHPNYFGEVTQWWGLFLIVSTIPNWYLAIISPLTITCLILLVSGIPMTERPFESNPEFKKYKKVTSAFFPWFPNKR